MFCGLTASLFVLKSCSAIECIYDRCGPPAFVVIIRRRPGRTRVPGWGIRISCVDQIPSVIIIETDTRRVGIFVCRGSCHVTLAMVRIVPRSDEFAAWQGEPRHSRIC